MKKSDVETHYEHGRSHPAVNVKHHLWVPDLIRKYKDDGHEFSGDAGFWAWLKELWDRSDYDALDGPDEFARESCWDDAQTVADEIWPERTVKVWSEGRSGGWCVVHGLPDIEDWDAIALGRWARFEKQIKQIAHEGYPYDFIWHAYVNVWERVREERRNVYPAPNYEGVNA